jgi:hypothetical protein
MKVTTKCENFMIGARRILAAAIETTYIAAFGPNKQIEDGQTIIARLTRRNHFFAHLR